MKKSSIIILQIATALLGIGVLIFMFLEPQIEGRNVNASNFEIYFKDPFLLCVYVASIAFFVGLYQIFKLLGYIKQNKTFSGESVKALQKIKYCSMTLVAWVVAGEVYLGVFQRGKDDIAGGVFMGLLLIFIFGVSALLARMFESMLQKAIDIKSENELTV